MQKGSDVLEGREEERPHVPTLKEQWQAKREANVVTREAAAAERKRKKEALHAALVAQQKQAEKDEREMNGSGSHNNPKGGGGGDNGEDAEELRLRQAAADAEAALTEAQVNAQLAVFQAYMQNNPDVEDDLNDMSGNPASLFDREVASQAARKTLTNQKRKPRKGAPGKGNEDEDDIIEDVSVHSSDYENEELMQGLNDLDEEIEAEFQAKIESLQAQVAQHKQASLACLREQNDRPAALEELQKAKALEAQIKSLMDSHAEPLRVQVEKQERKIAELEELVATRKQESLAALRGGDKPTALEKLKESKGFQSQLDEAKTKLTELEEEKARQLRSTGES